MIKIKYKSVKLSENKMPSMDIVSEINIEEVRNATENANRELSTRFDFRGVEASLEWKKPNVVVKAEGDFQVKQLVDMLRSQLTKRQVDAKAMTVGEPEFSGRNCSATISFKEGIEQPVAKKLVKIIKDSKLKVQASIQGEQLRVTGKKRDDLQAVMRLVKDSDLEQSFQFNNFKD
jgi:cyclic-di-GMP-binding protein